MNIIYKKTLLMIQILASVFIALYAQDISTDIISSIYVRIEGHYLPFAGYRYKYYFWQLFLTGALCVAISYVLLYTIKKNIIIISSLLLISFIIDALYTYKVMGDPYVFHYEIILGGLVFIVLHEKFIKNIKESRAFIIATLVSSTCYWLYTIALFKYNYGVMPNFNIGFFYLILFFASVGAIFIATPIYFVLLKTKFNKNWVIIILGSLIGGVIISYYRNGILWQHPEGLFTGIIAALTFIYFREEKA